MIHAYALEPELVARWTAHAEYRFIRDKFGLGTPRVMLDVVKFTRWKALVKKAAENLPLTDLDHTRLTELLKLLSDRRSRRPDREYDSAVSWQENAEREFDRREFAAVLATANPRSHRGVVAGSSLDESDPRWRRDLGASPSRTPEGLTLVLAPLLVNSQQIHLIDPHFGPGNSRHRKVLEALLGALDEHGARPEVFCVHCGSKMSKVSFEEEARAMAARLPSTQTVSFRRWTARDGGEYLHNRYVLTDLGGVMLGVGLDEGREAEREGQTDDVLLLPPTQYERRWSQYAEANGAFALVDEPAPVTGARQPRR